MTLDRRAILALSSIGIALFVVGAAILLGPRAVRFWMIVSGAIGLALWASSLTAEPWELLPALAFCLPPVIALASNGAPFLWVGGSAALLLMAAELNAMSWEWSSPRTKFRSRPLLWLPLAQLGLSAFAASTLVGVASTITLGSATLAVVAASAALVGVGWLTFRPKESA